MSPTCGTTFFRFRYICAAQAWHQLFGPYSRYRIDADVLSESLVPWLATYERYWAVALDRLRELAGATGNSVRRS